MHSVVGASGLRMRDRSALETKSATSSSAFSRSGSSCSRDFDLESGLRSLMTTRAADVALSRAVVAPIGASWNASVASAKRQHSVARSAQGERMVLGFRSSSARRAGRGSLFL